MKKPTILISNDDGVYAPGIKHLCLALKELANTFVVAPTVEQSATSLSISIRKPLKIEKINWGADFENIWAVNGTPADCIKLALTTILPHKPDLIVSGINRGKNVGRNILYSGTVAAVIEGVMHDIRGIALSASDLSDPNYSEFEPFIKKLVSYFLEVNIKQPTFLNVNFPPKTTAIKGIELATQGKEFWIEDPQKRFHPFEEEPYFWLGGKIATFKETGQSDVTLLSKGFITVVPVQINELTDFDFINKNNNSFQKFFN